MRQDAEALALGHRGQDTAWFHGPVAEAAATYTGEDLRARQFRHGDAVIAFRSSLFLLLGLRGFLSRVGLQPRRQLGRLLLRRFGRRLRKQSYRAQARADDPRAGIALCDF